MPDAFSISRNLSFVTPPVGFFALPPQPLPHSSQSSFVDHRTLYLHLDLAHIAGRAVMHLERRDSRDDSFKQAFSLDLNLVSNSFGIEIGNNAVRHEAGVYRFR
jgi:hypothetical protein